MGKVTARAPEASSGSERWGLEGTPQSVSSRPECWQDHLVTANRERCPVPEPGGAGWGGDSQQRPRRV